MNTLINSKSSNKLYRNYKNIFDTINVSENKEQQVKSSNKNKNILFMIGIGLIQI